MGVALSKRKNNPGKAIKTYIYIFIFVDVYYTFIISIIGLIRAKMHCLDIFYLLYIYSMLLIDLPFLTFMFLFILLK